MTRYWIRRSRFGWWVACDPDEPVATLDTPTYYHSFSRDKLVAKMQRKFAPSPSPWTEERVSLPDILAIAKEGAEQLVGLRNAIEAVLMDANVTYGIVFDDNVAGPMMVERLAIVRALGYEDESAWLVHTSELQAVKERTT